MNRLKGKVSLITGANSGIGRRTAEVFANEGSNLVLIARRIEKLREVEDICKEKGVNAISISAVDTAMAEISDRHIDRTLTPATVDDQAKAILYFASDDSIAVTGQTIVVDRGTSL